jgi:hypothetical protein
MTKRFALTPELICPELDGYKLPEIESGLEKARRILSDGIKTNMSLSSAIAELDKLIREERPPIAIEVEMVVKYNPTLRDWQSKPATHPDGTVKGNYIYN